MVTATRSSAGGTWAKSLLHPATEFGPVSLSVISGSVPAGLRGSLYRNGPARLERGGQRVGHWFDGDGAILGVHFTDAGTTGTYRYVQTAGYQAEEKAGKFLLGGYGMTPPGSFWQRLTQGTLKNAANTSVLSLPDRLLALWEGGPPHALDLATLETRGIDPLDFLTDSLTFSAHPKCDPQTGDFYNFGVSYGAKSILNLYHCTREGKLRQKATVDLKGSCLVHDFAIAGPYLIFLVPPITLRLLPILLKSQSFSEALTWHPDQATQILVIDRETLTLVSRSETAPEFQWHFANGFVEPDGTVVVHWVRYADFQTNQFLREVSTGETHTAAPGILWQMRLNPQTGQVLQSEAILDRRCEFPSIAPHLVGQDHRSTYLSVHQPNVDPNRELFGAIARFDHHTSDLTITDLGADRYPTEAIYARDRDRPEQGWILSVVFDGKLNTSEVWIWAADHLDTEPVCRLGLPSVVPLGFHGTWRPEQR